MGELGPSALVTGSLLLLLLQLLTGSQLGEPSTRRLELLVGSGHSADGSTAGLGSMPTGLPVATGLGCSGSEAGVGSFAAPSQQACLPQWQSSQSVRGWPQQARL